MKRVLVLATLGAMLTVAAPASATLLYVKNVHSVRFKPSVWVANDDGSGRRRLVTGDEPKLSPDGTKVIYRTIPTRADVDSSIRLIPTAGGAPKALLAGVNDLQWSPDSRHVLAVPTHGNRMFRLLLIDATTGARRTIDRGFFDGMSFSPDGQNVVYSRSSRCGCDADLYTATVVGGAPRRITSDHHNKTPVWGPAFIAYAHEKPTIATLPTSIFRIDSDGTDRRAITHDKRDPFYWGVSPVAFSADGASLLAQSDGLSLSASQAVAVNPQTGAERVLGNVNTTTANVAAISKDGLTVLAGTFPRDPKSGASGDVISVPFAGGHPTVLIRNASHPDWNR